MDPQVEEYITYLNNESERLYKLVDTNIGNWLPQQTFNEAMSLLATFEERLPMIKTWTTSYEADLANQTEIWLRQGLDLIDRQLFESNIIESYIYGKGQHFEAPDGSQYILDYTEKKPALPMTPEINAIHEGKPCESNGWFCWICEEQECEQYKLQQAIIKSSKNIFINKTLQEPFIKAAVEVSKPPDTWNPSDYFLRLKSAVKIPHYGYSYNDNDNNEFAIGLTYGQQIRRFIKKYIQILGFWYYPIIEITCCKYLQIERKMLTIYQNINAMKESASKINF